MRRLYPPARPGRRRRPVNCRDAYEKQLRYLRQLHTQGLLTNEQCNKQAQETWERFRHCV